MAKKNKNNVNANADLSQQSLDFLGLNKQPFLSQILTEKSFFNHQAIIKITENLTHQIQFSDLLLLVEGAQGSGKTSLYRQFIQTEISNTKLLSMQAEATDTLVQIQQKMSIHLQDMGDANHLDDNLKSLQMFDQTPAVIINNSHVLSDTTLQELLRYQQQLKQESDISLKVLFFANTGMTQTLQNITEIQPDQMYVQNLPPLSPKQADSFIMHRLNSSGYSGEPLFESDDILLLSKKCNGTPQDIMTQAAPLIDKIIIKKLNPGTALWLKVFLAVLILATLSAGAYFINKILFNEEDSSSLATDTLLSNSSTQTDTKTVIKPQDEAPLYTLEEKTDVIDVLENEEVIYEEHAQSEPVPVKPVPEKNIPEKPVPDETIITQPDQKIMINTSEQIATTELPVEAKTASEPVISKEPTTTTPINKPEIISETPPLHPALLQLEKIGLQDVNWIMQQHKQNWTLQLLGARDPKTLLKFARRYKLSANTAWYKTWLTSRPYYVLVHGSYTSRDAARNSIASLPPQIRSLKPWVKSMKSVQKALK
jgi:DamX protein